MFSYFAITWKNIIRMANVLCEGSLVSDFMDRRCLMIKFAFDSMNKKCPFAGANDQAFKMQDNPVPAFDLFGVKRVIHGGFLCSCQIFGGGIFMIAFRLGCLGLHYCNFGATPLRKRIVPLVNRTNRISKGQ